MATLTTFGEAIVVVHEAQVLPPVPKTTDPMLMFASRPLPVTVMDMDPGGPASRVDGENEERPATNRNVEKDTGT